jgi:hypothetical protein
MFMLLFCQIVYEIDKDKTGKEAHGQSPDRQVRENVNHRQGRLVLACFENVGTQNNPVEMWG